MDAVTREICWGEKEFQLPEAGRRRQMIRAMERKEREERMREAVEMIRQEWAENLQQIHTVSGNIVRRHFQEESSESGNEQPHDQSNLLDKHNSN